MNRRTCPGCGGRSFSSYSGPNWDCPYCGRDLGRVPNELDNLKGDSLKATTPPVKLYAIKTPKKENRDFFG